MGLLQWTAGTGLHRHTITGGPFFVSSFAYMSFNFLGGNTVYFTGAPPRVY
jgi:hypothetical protein